MDSPKRYDVIIIGGGPAGLTAAMYCARAKLSTLLIEKGLVGGKINEAELVDNYPGFDEGIGGYDLSQKMFKQAQRFGLEMVASDVTGLTIGKDEKIAHTPDGDYHGRTVIVTGGSERQKLNVPGETEFTGRGVSYCATCDAPFFKDKAVVVVVGGGNVAVYEALHLTKFAGSVKLIHRRDQLRADAVAQEKAQAEPKLSFIWDSAITAIEGNDSVKRIKIKNLKTGAETTLDVDGIFVAIGIRPNTEFLKGVVGLDEKGAVLTNCQMETNVPGVMAAGDIRQGSIRQTVAACGDGAVAATSAKKYLDES